MSLLCNDYTINILHCTIPEAIYWITRIEDDVQTRSTGVQEDLKISASSVIVSSGL